MTTETNATTTLDTPPLPGPKPGTPTLKERLEKAGKQTEYVLVMMISTEDFKETWLEIGRVTAPSAQAAIRAHGQAGTYVAIPASSWKPQTVKVENVPKVTIEEAV